MWIFIFVFTMIEGLTPDRYDFLPYELKVLPGNVGTGDRGWVSAPGIYITNGSHPVAHVPIELKRVDLGWAGDYIVDYDRIRWNVVGCAEGTTHPAIVLSTFGSGKIVYVTNQLYEFHKLLCNIFTWFSSNKSAMQVALMVDVPIVPEVPSIDRWDRSFSEVNSILKQYKGPRIEWTDIHAYNLNEETLQEVDVLILMTGWGDGYFSGSSGWYNAQRAKAIMNFIEKGGCLLLPEAGFRNRIVPSFYVLLEMFSSATTCLTMIAPSITFAVAVVALKRELPELSESKAWIVLVCCFITAANLWIIAAALVYSFQVDVAAFVISTAFLLDVLPWIFIFVTVMYRAVRQTHKPSIDSRPG